MRGTFKTALAALVALGIAVPPAAATSRIKDLAEYRGRPAEPADRLRPRRRPQRHRRHAQQHAFHQAIAASDAGTARRQHPRPADPHRQRRRRDGDRQPAAVRHAGHPHRRHRLGHGRRQEPAGRHAAGDPAARRRRQRLRGRAGLARHRRVPSRRVEAAKITRGVPTVGRLPNGAIIEREIEFSLNTLGQLRLALRNADFTTAKRIAVAINDYMGAPVAEPLDPVDSAAHAAEEISRERRRDAHRHRAVAGRAG